MLRVTAVWPGGRQLPGGWIRSRFLCEPGVRVLWPRAWPGDDKAGRVGPKALMEGVVREVPRYRVPAPVRLRPSSGDGRAGTLEGFKARPSSVRDLRWSREAPRAD